MKLISSSTERDWYLVKEWVTRSGLPARIHQCKWKLNDPESDISKHMKEVSPEFKSSLPDHLTGYVQVPDGDEHKYYDSPDILVHGGVTFEDKMEDDQNRWVGFDLGHYMDDKIADPEGYATQECENLAKQILAQKTKST